MPSDVPIEIKNDKVILTEGDDDKQFLEQLCDYLKLIDKPQIVISKGTPQILSYIGVLKKTTGFSRIKKLAIIRDADDDLQAAFESIRNALTRTELPPPNSPGEFTDTSPQIGVFIFPNNADGGTIESLCLSTVEKDPAFRCVKSFTDCVESLNERPKNLAKSQALVFLATKPKFCNNPGLGAAKGYWDFASTKMNPLKNFMKHLAD
jgi:hypothetical protein